MRRIRIARAEKTIARLRRIQKFAPERIQGDVLDAMEARVQAEKQKIHEREEA